MKSTFIRPLITEKTMHEAEKGKFSFIVPKYVDKTEVKRFIEHAFGVNVIGVITSIVKGKRMRVGKMRIKSAAPSFKKAIVELKEGQKIGLFELGS